ncbi:BrnA antitoxin family protein [Pseudoflavonifractor phocaeensis]|uniref:BrnA antitoxin family protein n=1 Tax=Pseudoflavonifractor phocaeensis TaxID=1870988 RepID=UPI0030B8B6DF
MYILTTCEVRTMREEYDIKNLNPRRNPYVKKAKKQITINIDNDTVDYFKGLSESSGIPYQTLINLYLSDCAAHQKKLHMTWS